MFSFSRRKNLRNISKDILSNQYKRVYLLFGDETYLKHQYKNKLIKGICGDDTMNYSYFEGKNIDTVEVIGISETLPFFADLRAVVIENSGFLKNSNEALADYLTHIPETTTIIFVEEEVDKRSKVYKKIKDSGYICEMTAQPVEVLKKWIVGILESNDKKIKESTLNHFIDTVGTDMENIHSEMEKLVCYCLDKEIIENDDIDAVCTQTITTKIFDLIDALGYKNKDRALQIYYDLILNQEAPEMILYMLSRQFNIMIQVSELKRMGLNSKQMTEKMGLAPFVITKTLRQIDNFSYSALQSALEESIDLSEKTRNDMIDKKIAIEMMIIKYASKKI